jgi:hypothetical protein
VTETLAPLRNFTLTNAERVRALGGPAAYMRRRRSIEDLAAAMVADIRAARARLAAQMLESRGERDDDAIDEALLADPPRTFVRLVELIEAHNRYYPIEANLPIDPRTGELVEHGRPYRPMPVPVLADFLRATRL